MPSSRIAICLYKKGIQDLDRKILLGKKKLKIIEITEATREPTLLVVKETEPNLPSWHSIVEQFSDLEADTVLSSSSGAILFFKYKRRVIGCCFGTSTAYINRDNTIPNFGLGAAFQEIRNENTKSLESFTLSNNPLTINRVTTNPTQRHNYEVDRQSENITELSGFNYRDSKRILIKGKEFYSTPSPLNLKEIIKVGKAAFNNYERAIKDKAFQDLTSSSVVKDPEVLNELDKELCLQINGKTDLPTIVDYEYFPEISEYRLRANGDSFNNPEISDFYSTIQTESVTINYLKSRKLIPYDSSATPLASWSIYRCLFIELEFDEEVYILFKGKWYLIDANFLARLRTTIQENEIEIEDVTPWDGAIVENTLNTNLAAELGGQLWDEKLYSNRLYPHGIEFCDVLTEDKVIHVKKWRRSSTTSYLLNQTSVSAILLRNDPELLNWISDKADELHNGDKIILDEQGKLKNEQMSYLMLFMSTSEKKPSEFLPFFMLVALQITIRRINQLGFKVEVGKI